jgi:hypothetical protein
MEELLLTLIDRIATGMPELITVDEDYGQLEALDNENTDQYPLCFPAVLIDSPDTSWDNIGQGSQKGICTVITKLIIDCYDDTHYGHPHKKDSTDKITERSEKVKALHKLLQNLPVGDSSSLIRTRSRFYTTGRTGIKVYEITYTCVVSEELEKNVTAKKMTGIKIVPGIIRAGQQ